VSFIFRTQNAIETPGVERIDITIRTREEKFMDTATQAIIENISFYAWAYKIFHFVCTMGYNRV